MGHTGITYEQYKKGGYAKYNLKRSKINEIHSRAVDGTKIYTGGDGRDLRAKRKEVQNHTERNKTRRLYE